MLQNADKRDLSLFFLVLLLAFFVRIYHLSSIPAGVDWDEVSNGYNGFAILRTGADEFNQKFPILFRGFDAYVPPVLIYLNALSVFLFGLNEFAIRLPNVILGTLAVFGLYLLVRELSSRKKLALLAAFFLAVSPYQIIYSRVDTFASVPIVFVIFGTYFFIKSLRNKRYLGYSVVSLLIAIFSYFSAYIFVPIYACMLVFIYRGKLNIKYIIMFLVPLLAGSMLILFVLPGGQSRLQGISSLSDPDVIKVSSLEALNEGRIGKILHNRRFVYVQKLLEGYFSPFNFSFLFSKSDSIRRMIVSGPGFGLLYWWDFIFLLAGLYFILLKKVSGWQVILAWFFLVPFPASPALPQPASTRLTLISPAVATIIAWGFWILVNKQSRIIKSIVVLLLSVNIFVFLHQYFVHYPAETSNEWFYAYKPLFNYLNKNEFKNKKVFFVFSQPDFLDQVHIFSAFYNRIDPETYQQSGGTKLGRFGTTGEFSIERYYFIPDNCKICGNSTVKSSSDLVVTSQKMLSEPVKIINSLDGKEVLYVYRTEVVSVEDVLKRFIESGKTKTNHR